MGFFADYEDEKKKRKIDGGKTGSLPSFFVDTGKNIVAGLQQGGGVLADLALEGGFVLGSIGQSDEDLVKSQATTEMLRGLVHDMRDINGNNIAGTQKADESAQKLQAGEGDIRDVAQIAGTSLDAGLAATTFVNPLSAARATALETGAKLTGKEAAKDIAKVGATFGGTSAVTEGSKKYAETGDLGEAVQTGLVSGVTGAVVPTVLDVAGRGAGLGLREVLNKNVVDKQVATKAEMTNGTKAAQQATDSTGKPVTQSQVVNSAEPEVSRMSMEDLSTAAERPVGMTPAEYIKSKNSEPTSMAAEVTPGRDLVVEMPGGNGKMGTESGGRPAADAPVTGIVAKPAIVQDAPRPSAIDEVPLNPARLNELAPEVQKLVDTRVARNDSTGRTGQAKFLDKYTKGFINRTTEDLGKLGADVSESMVRGAKVKSDIGNELRPIMQDIDKGVKKVAGKTEVGQEQFMSKVDKALQDRDNAASYFDNADEQKVYQNIQKVYDYIMQERIDRGLPVRKDYSPTQMIRAGGEDPSYLASSLNSKITTADSRFSKERKGEGADQAVFNTRDLFNYANSQSTEFAYKEAADMFREGIKNVPPELANSKSFQDGIRRLADAYAKAVNPSATTKGDKAIKFFQSTVYKNILWNNPKNAAFSTAQTLIARGDVTKDAKAIAKSFDKDTLKELYDQKWFGDATISADMQSDTRMSQLAQGASKYDINRVGEEYAVKKPFALGVAQGLSETKAYKDAVKAGKSKAEAAKIALADPVAHEYAVRAGNVLVNDTAFGANSMARPEFLRDASAVKRAFTMFLRFPLGMTELVGKSMRPAEARAINVLMKGDPRATPVPEMRQKYQKTLVALDQIEKAAKDGKLGDIKLDAIQDSIKATKENIKVVDETIKELSSIRGNKRATSLIKMWAATAAIQFAWSGLTDPENASPIDAIAQSDPTIASKVNPLNPYSVERSGLTSPLIPANRYGINWNGATNLVPGAGIINRGVKTVTGTSAVDWLRGKNN